MLAALTAPSFAVDVDSAEAFLPEQNVVSSESIVPYGSVTTQILWQGPPFFSQGAGKTWKYVTPTRGRNLVITIMVDTGDAAARVVVKNSSGTILKSLDFPCDGKPRTVELVSSCNGNQYSVGFSVPGGAARITTMLYSDIYSN